MDAKFNSICVILVNNDYALIYCLLGVEHFMVV